MISYRNHIETLSYKNQFFDLGSKSMDWFLYDNGLRPETVKGRRRNFLEKNDGIFYI